MSTYRCCGHCRWDTVPQPHHHAEMCTQPGCAGVKRERWTPTAPIPAMTARPEPTPIGAAPTTVQEDDEMKNFNTYNGRRVELTRNDGKVWVGDALVKDDTVTIFTRRPGKPPVVPTAAISKIRLAK